MSNQAEGKMVQIPKTTLTEICNALRGATRDAIIVGGSLGACEEARNLVTATGALHKQIMLLEAFANK